jgi:hypothetical protein
MIEMTPAENILFVKDDEVAVIKRGLREQSSGHMHNKGRRPSPLGGARRYSSQRSPSETKINLMAFSEPVAMDVSDSE